MKAIVHVALKNGVLDPQGEAVRHALGNLGFEGVEAKVIFPGMATIWEGLAPE